jgi:hypothetical protein
MRRLNIANPAFTYDAVDPDGFRAGMLRLGPLTATRLPSVAVAQVCEELHLGSTRSWE